MQYFYISYFFRQQEVRVYCKTDGSDGQWVLEDILRILFPNDWKSRLTGKLKLVDDLEKDALTRMVYQEGIIQSEIHVAEPFVAREFLAYCDDAGNEDPKTYNELEKWLSERSEFLERDMALLGESHPKLRDAWEYAARVTEEGRANQRFTVEQWFRNEFEIDLPWLIAPMQGIFSQQMAHGRRMMTGQPVDKSENQVNVYRCSEFGEVYSEASKMIAGETIFNQHNYKESLVSFINSDRRDGRREQLQKEEKRMIPLLGSKKSDEEIIWELWKTSSKSSHQYALLSQFLDVVRRRQNIHVRK
ncbi:MAG TPA: hypothetical protein V6D50_22105 [Chroococcales cyanobacterium]|jgi:hypothetical protein